MFFVHNLASILWNDDEIKFSILYIQSNLSESKFIFSPLHLAHPLFHLKPVVDKESKYYARNKTESIVMLLKPLHIRLPIL